MRGSDNPPRTPVTPPPRATLQLQSIDVPMLCAQVVAWYDNEWGYSQRVLDLAELVASEWE